MHDKFTMMTTGPVERLVLRMAAPTIAMMLISAIYNMADTYYVGGLGTSATAAVGVSFSLMALIQAVGFFFGHGAGNYIARELGAQRYDNAGRMAATGFATTLSVGAALAAAGLANLDHLAELLGSTPTILPHAREYLFYILVAMPWMASSFTLNNLLRFQGSAVYGMIGMASGAVLNIILDPIFIFVLDMGVGGAGLATMISQMVGFSLLLRGCARPGNIRIRPGNIRPSLAAYREIAMGGFPSLCRQGLAGTATIVLNHTAAGFGDAAVAAIAIVQRVGMFAGSALIGFGQGFQPVCGFNYGAGLYARVGRAFFFCVKTSSVALVFIAAVGAVFASEIVALFRRDDPRVIEIGTLALRLQCLTFPLSGWIILNNMMLQTIGKAWRASVLALARQGLFLMPVLFALTPRFGVLGIQLAQPGADAATFFLSLWMGTGVLREMREMEERPPPPCEPDPAALEGRAAVWEG
ncbi:MAG: MATE family efflux transporter [Planctomycetota bacterium]|nr:MATE family efflux transporter [Planctomycetota bacterium]